MFKNFFIILFFLILIGQPFRSYALTTFFDIPKTEIKVGDTVPVKLYVNTENDSINVLEGTFNILGNVNVLNINTDGSVFNLWPEEPVFLDNQIYFTGGVGGGVGGSKLRVVDFNLVPKQSGTIVIEPERLSGYLSDGLGTEVVGVKNKFEVKVAPGNVSETVFPSYSRGGLLFYIVIIVLFVILGVYLVKRFFKKKNEN